MLFRKAVRMCHPTLEKSMPYFRLNTDFEGVPSHELVIACESYDTTWIEKFSAYRELMKREGFSSACIAFVSLALRMDSAQIRHRAYLFALSDVFTLHSRFSEEEKRCTIERLSPWIPLAASETDVLLFEGAWLLRYLIGDTDVHSTAQEIGPPLRLSLDVFVKRFQMGKPIWPLTLIQFPLFVAHGSPIYRG